MARSPYSSVQEGVQSSWKSPSADRPGKRAALLLNLVLIVMGAIGTAAVIRSSGIRGYIFYTNVSNLMGLVSAVLYTVSLLRESRGGQRPPHWICVFRYMSACVLTVTFLVVAFVLAPMVEDGLRYFLFSGQYLFTHFLCPVLTIISVCFFERDWKATASWTLAGVLPTVIYAGVTIPLNALYILHGPYPFLLVHEQPVRMSVLWCVVIVGGAYVAALILWLIKRIGDRR